MIGVTLLAFMSFEQLGEWALRGKMIEKRNDDEQKNIHFVNTDASNRRERCVSNDLEQPSVLMRVVETVCCAGASRRVISFSKYISWQ